MALKQKTINYLHSSANMVDKLLGKAIEYKSKFNAAKTTVAKEFYKKRLTKTINQLEPYMKMFKSLEELNAAAPNTEQSNSQEK
jgi:hypothetical protein